MTVSLEAKPCVSRRIFSEYLRCLTHFTISGIITISKVLEK